MVSMQDTNKPYNSGTWTAARFHSFIKSALRSASQRWGPRFDVLNAAKTEKKINKASGRIAQHYKCNRCKEDFPAKEVQVDHIKEVIDPSVGFVSWDNVIENMFCEASGLQILCLECHKDKTNKAKEIAKSRQIT